MIEKLKPAIKQGLIMGLVGALIVLLVWAFAPEMFGSFSWLITQSVVIMLALPIVFIILGTRNTKEQYDSFNYGQAFKAAFTVGLAATLFGLVFNLIFYTVIDPEFDTRVQEMVTESTLERLENANMSDEMIDEQMEKLEERFENQKGFAGKAKSSFWLLVWYSVLAAIIAIVYKDKKDQQLAS